MPFTLSHPSIVLLLKKVLPAAALSITAMVVGSMVPDVEGLLFMDTGRRFAHTWLGMFVFDVPVGLALCFLWHGVVRVSFIDNAPAFLKQRFYRYRDVDWNGYFRKHWVVVMVSLLIGIATHLLWDHFTHSNGHDDGPWHQKPIYVLGHKMADFIFRQYLSSVVGLVVGLFFLFTLPRSTYVPPVRWGWYWPVALVVAGVAVFTKLVVVRSQPFVLTRENVAYIVVVVLSASLLGIFVASIVDRLVQRAT